MTINNLMIVLAVLKYCAIALQAAVEEKLRIVDDYIFGEKNFNKNCNQDEKYKIHNFEKK